MKYHLVPMFALVGSTALHSQPSVITKNELELPVCFSSVEPDSNGDPKGENIYIFSGYSSVWVLFQFIDGNVSDPILVATDISNAKIHFKLPKSCHPYTEFTGTIRGNQLTGSFNKSKTLVKLKRISKFASAP